MGSYPITMYRGTTKTIDLAIVKADGTAQDLTGGRLVLTVREEDGARTSLIVKDSADAEIDIYDETGGLARTVIDPEETDHIAPGSYRYDVWFITDGEEKLVVVEPDDFVIKKTVGHPVLV